MLLITSEIPPDSPFLSPAMIFAPTSDKSTFLMSSIASFTFLINFWTCGSFLNAFTSFSIALITPLIASASKSNTALTISFLNKNLSIATNASPIIAVNSKISKLNRLSISDNTLNASLNPPPITEVTICKIANKPLKVRFKLFARSSLKIRDAVNL